MDNPKLDREERALIDAIIADVWQSVPDVEREIGKHRQYAKNTIKEKQIHGLNSRKNRTTKTQIPLSMQIQLARLFGDKSSELKTSDRTDSEWKRTLQKMLDELFKYAEKNVETDQSHWVMICSGFTSSQEALKTDDYWAGYIEGIMKVCYLLMGDYPDHRKYKGGRKKIDHYSLDYLRDSVFIQNHEQKQRTIYSVSISGLLDITGTFRYAMAEFRTECGYEGGAKEFLNWFKLHYPIDYATLF